MSRQVSPFTLEQVQALFRACRLADSAEEHFLCHALLALLLDSGLSPAEVATLSVKRLSVDVGFDEPAYVVVSPKGRDQYKAWLGQHARKALALYLDKYRPRTRSVALFVDEDGEQLTPQALRRLITRLGTREPLEGVAVTVSKFRATHLEAQRRLGTDASVLDAFDAESRRRSRRYR